MKIRPITFLTSIIFIFIFSQNLLSKTGQSIDSWVWVASAPAAAANGVAVCATDDAVYVFRGGATTFWKYIPLEDRWVWLSSAPAATGTGSDLVWTGGDFIYATRGAFTNEFWEYHISGDSWTVKASFVNVSSGCSLAWTGENYIYAAQGDGTGFYMYDITKNLWVSTTSLPLSIGGECELAWDGENYLYVYRDRGTTTFYKYDLSSCQWSSRPSLPWGSLTPGIGASLVWDRVTCEFNNLFGHRGANSTHFVRFCVTHSSWNCTQDNLPYSDPADTPINIGTVRGQRLACIGDYIYCFGSTGTVTMLRYRWRDVDPPGKITGFVAEASLNGGEINLSWVCPGNDKVDENTNTGDLPQGSTFYIQYSSFTEDVVFSTSSPQNVYEIWIPTGPVSQGQRVSYTVGGLLEDVTYYFRIWAKDNAGNWSEMSDGTTCFIDLPPPIPQNVSVIPSGNSILISWDSVDVYDLDYYELWCDSTTPYDFTDQFIATTTKNTLFLHIGLENYGTYYYRVRAVDLPPTVLYSEFSEPVSTYPIPIPPFAPSLSYDLTETTTWQIKWILTDNSVNEESLHISSDTDILARLWSSEGLADYGKTTFWIETGFTPNQQVTRYAEAYNTLGSSWSAAVSVYTKANPPTELSFYFVGHSSVGIQWSNNNNPNYTRYEVSYSLDNFQTHFSTPIKFSDNWVLTSTSIVNLQSNTTHWFRVRACNEENIETMFSNIVSTCTKEIPINLLRIVNPGFEMTPELVGWTKEGTSLSSILRSSKIKRSGRYSCLFKDPTSLYTGRGIVSSTSSVVGGEKYLVGGWFYVKQESGTITDTQIRIGIRLIDGNDVVISTSTSSDLTLQNFNTWELLTYSAVAPVNASKAVMIIHVKETKNNDNDVYVDDVMSLEEVSLPPLSKPQGLKAKRILDGTKAEISWSPNPAQGVSYDLYKSTFDDVNSMFLIITTQQLYYNDTDYLDLATTYYYVLKAKKDTQESEFSDICVLPSDNIKPIIEHKGLTSRMLSKKPLYLKVLVKDYLSEVGDDQGRIYYLKGKVRTKDKPTTTQDLSFSPQLSGYPTYYYAEAEIPQEIISDDGIEYYLEVSDGRWKVYWPSAEEEKYYIVEPPKDKPEQKFITPKNSELVFGKEVEEVLIRDYNGNEIWKQKSNGSNIIVWRGEDQGGKKIESGAYIYRIKTKDGKRKYGVVIVVK